MGPVDTASDPGIFHYVSPAIGGLQNKPQPIAHRFFFSCTLSQAKLSQAKPWSCTYRQLRQASRLTFEVQQPSCGALVSRRRFLDKDFSAQEECRYAKSRLAACFLRYFVQRSTISRNGRRLTIIIEPRTVQVWG